MGAAFLLYTYVAHNPVLWALLAIMIVAWHVGFGPGVLAALVVIAVSRLLFQPNAPLAPSGAELMRLGLFLAMNSLIAALSSTRQRAEASLIKTNAELDRRVESKTAELRAANEALTKQVTQTRETQRELERVNQMKDQFLAMLGHELRNPLAAISSAVMVLELDPPPERRAKVNETLARQVKHLTRIMDDLLDGARIRQGKLSIHAEETQLTEIVRTAVELSLPQIEEAGHQLTVDVLDQPTTLHVDLQRMAQVLSNLLSNAAKYTPAGGRITLSAKETDGGVSFTVRDTGIGIPPEKQPNIFDLFAQLEESNKAGSSGLGLGLAIARALVELHGGSIGVASDGAGTGAEFRVWIPALVSGGAPVAQSIPAASSGSTGTKRKLLVVDDDRGALEMLTLVLEMHGFEVHAAQDGDAALNLLREYQPDAVLMDLSMPGMDGWEAARRIRSEPWGKGLKLIALSGWAQEQHRARSQEAGFDLHWVKPLRLSNLEVLFAEGTRP
jgi:signal transduction histidine kinase